MNRRILIGVVDESGSEGEGDAMAPRARVPGRPGRAELNVDNLAVNGRHTQLVGPPLKWTFFGSAPEAALAAALSLSAVFATLQGSCAGGQFVVPATWQAPDALQMNVNLGIDWLPGSGASTYGAGSMVNGR